ncbi:hypothetical protein L3V86_02085 [Thiotrichales bacterium 19S11-10]|nr:hypothetical protein [Thiotrichales bacterium 19S11-10]
MPLSIYHANELEFRMITGKNDELIIFDTNVLINQNNELFIAKEQLKKLIHDDGYLLCIISDSKNKAQNLQQCLKNETLTTFFDMIVYADSKEEAIDGCTKCYSRAIGKINLLSNSETSSSKYENEMFKFSSYVITNPNKANLHNAIQVIQTPQNPPEPFRSFIANLAMPDNVRPFI